MPIEPQNSMDQIPLRIEDQEEIVSPYGKLHEGRAQLVSPEGKSRRLPDSL